MDLAGRKNDFDALRQSEFWALKNISFQIKKGEVVGILGRNGAGKSTLIRLLAGLYKPTTGHITREGRASTIFAGTSGMDAMLSGRENVYVRAAIIGADRATVDEKMDEIIEFSELEDFIDSPLGTYSSGMKARLAFAVNVAFPVEVFLLDEGLAVGDRIFKKKCIKKLREISEDTIIINVSHSPAIMRSLCSRIIVLEGGTIKTDTPNINAALSEFLQNSEFDYFELVNDYWEIENRNPEIIINSVALKEADAFNQIQVNLSTDVDIKGKVTISLIDQLNKPSLIEEKVNLMAGEETFTINLEKDLFSMRPSIKLRLRIGGQIVSKAEAINQEML